MNHAYLRNILSSFDGQHEVILDILISLLDQLSWRPDYLPSPSIGLPQVQFDAPRLLAHIYLFEIDELLKARTSDRFVRWVDDMTLAVPSQEAGKLLLRDLDTLLQMRGLRLNSGKTKILSASAAAKYFHRGENARIDAFAARVKALKGAGGASRKILITDIRSAFKAFSGTLPQGHHFKVCARYVGLAADLRSNFAVTFMRRNFNSEPELRDVFYRYARALGPNARVFSILDKYIRSEHAIDDASICHIAQVLVDWELPNLDPIRLQIRSLARLMKQTKFISRSPHRFSASLVVNVKYETESGLVNFIRRSKRLWSRSEYLSRQVCAAAARVRDLTFLEECGDGAIDHGFRSATSVVSEIKKLRAVKATLTPSLRGYINNGKNMTTYKIHRFLISLSILRAPKISKKLKIELKNEILLYVSDPFYRTMIQRS